jgi:hypothetical protein
MDFLYTVYYNQLTVSYNFIFNFFKSIFIILINKFYF